MGVMACDRSGCDRTMCDIMVDNSYVCDECANEFRDLIGEQQMPAGGTLTMFREFMQTNKVCRELKRMIDVDEFFRR